jgi:hypothetical protein
MNHTAIMVGRKRTPITELKFFDDTPGVFSGYLSVFHNEDSQGDVIIPGAFKKTLSDAEKKAQANNTTYLYPLLWQHDPNEPIGGIIEAREDQHGLYIKGQIDLDIAQGERVYNGMKKGYLSGMSIGYRTIKQTWKNQQRHLLEVALHEGSIVTFPANALATITTVKAIDFNSAYARAGDKLQREWYETFTALVKTMGSIMGDFTATDKTALVQASLEQFGTTLTDLVARSTQAAFMPMLDTVMFLDPDAMIGYDADTTPSEQKAGRVMSASNHQSMGMHLDSLENTAKALREMHKALAYEPDKSALGPSSDTPPDAGLNPTSDELDLLASLLTTIRKG